MSAERPWCTHRTRSGVHVHPVHDEVPHELSDDCICGPSCEFIDPDTGIAYPSGPLVVHHSLDGREFEEVASG